MARDSNANTLTIYAACSLKVAKRFAEQFCERFAQAQIDSKKVALVAAVGSDLEVTGLLAQTTQALASEQIDILAMHQGMRQVDIQVIVPSDRFADAVRALHAQLVEPHEHGSAIALA
jgi:aspartate kinase